MSKIRTTEEIIKKYFEDSEVWDNAIEYINYNDPLDIIESFSEIIKQAQKEAIEATVEYFSCCMQATPKYTIELIKNELLKQIEE